MKSITYKQALERINRCMNNSNVKINAFDVSIILCYLFDTDDKEKTLQDIMNLRGFKKKWKEKK